MVAEYHMQHKAPGKEGNAPLHDLTKVYPSDIYETLKDYADGNAGDLESMAIIRKAKGNPGLKVTIYRAVPKGLSNAKINSGDWVSVSPTYAKTHSYDLEGPGKDGKVIKKVVTAAELWTDGNSFNEWGYNP